MAKQSLAEDLLDLIKSACFYLPFWAVPIIAALPALAVYFLVSRYFLALINIGGSDSFTTLSIWAGCFVYIVSFAAGLAGWFGRKQRKLLAAQTNSLEKLRNLSWREFELLVAESYRQAGFSVTEGAGNAPDGGIDLYATAPSGGKVLIQCKHWKNTKIGVKIVREMLGVLAKYKAEKAVVIGTGSFTKEALAFAEGEPIQLVDGPTLLQHLARFQEKPEAVASEPVPETQTEDLTPQTEIRQTSPDSAFVPPKPQPSCPRCGSELMERVAKKGPNTGEAFLGCSAFPKCRHTQAAFSAS